MAKKKKHKISKAKQNKVVKNTIKNKPLQIKAVSNNYEEPVVENKIVKADNLVKDQDYVVSDVKFSLVLLAIIIGVFVLLYILLQNKSVSDQIYGVIKINF